MAERRFSDDEVAAIFERAAESQASQPPPVASSSGMTLAELQSIGRDVGIPAELVARAAREIEMAGRPAERRFLGLPIGVGRTVELPRRLTDDEWERLVVDLRETFDARGSVRANGSLRQWTNGNLQALLEPTATGQRLRLRTVKGDARSLLAVGLGFLTAGLGVFAVNVIGAAGIEPDLWQRLWFFVAMGGGLFGLGAIRLPAWARLLRSQMQEITARLARTLEAPGPADRIPRDTTSRPG